jgi:phosphoribosylamine--glycine ligase
MGNPYRGFLYIDVILANDSKLYLLDYNCRMAYPETETLTARISNFSELLTAVAFGNLDKTQITIQNNVAVCATVFAKGYPKKVKKGAEVTGIEQAEEMGCLVFPIGISNDGSIRRILGNTGRVALVVGTDENIEKAKDKAEKGASCIKFDGAWYGSNLDLSFQK